MPLDSPTRRGGPRTRRQLRLPVHEFTPATPGLPRPPASAPGTSTRRQLADRTARRTRSRPSTSSTASATTSPPRRSRFSRRGRRLPRRRPRARQHGRRRRDRRGGRPDGKHTDNAYMDTPPDGRLADDGDVPVLQRRATFRDVNGGDDAAIVYHEYTHGLSSRLVTVAPGGEQALNDRSRAAMGEGWSDFYAKDLLVEPVPGRRHGGARRGRHGRVPRLGAALDPTQPLDCPVGAAADACPGAGRTPAPAATPTATSAVADGPRGPRRRRDLGRDAVGPARRGRARSRPRDRHPGDAALAARADVPRRARRDPARGPPAVPAERPQRRDLGRLRDARMGATRAARRPRRPPGLQAPADAALAVTPDRAPHAARP